MANAAEGMKRTGFAALLFALTLCPAPSRVMAADTQTDTQPEPVVASQSAAEDDDAVPDSSAHRVKAPEIDIAGLRDPFESFLTILDQQNKQRMQSNRSKAADHEEQPLESFDLGALRLVAIMKMGTSRAAMVQDPEGKGYVVRAGSYIGRDNGRVVNISARSVEIMEDEFTADGNIVKRKAILTLNEVNQ